MALRLFELKLPLDHGPEDIVRAAARALSVPEKAILSCEVRREAVDARRKGSLHFSYTVDLELRDEARVLASRQALRVAPKPDESYRQPVPGRSRLLGRPIVVGAGPAGLFAALALARSGYTPLILERGKPVGERVADVERFWKEGKLDPESNAQFGEGGAGTFSDGKLTTLINDPRCAEILRLFVAAGADPSILASAKPHIGTDVLRLVLVNLRKTILGLGGEFRFGARLTGIEGGPDGLAAVEVNGSDRIATNAAVLAIGHSADDTAAILGEAGLAMEPKPFSIGLRIEHPQAMIDAAQYGRFAGHPRLGAADYKLAFHGPGGRSAYTFCMCPGGQVVAASSREGCLVTNGMSLAARDGRNANSALLVNVGPADFPSGDVLAGYEFQRRWEALAFALGGRDWKAPVQLAGDFVAGRASAALGAVEPTYAPGIRLANLRDALPAYVADCLARALPEFGRRIEGFDRPDAVLTGVETRSSSPVRMTRGPDFQASIRGLYPAGEGAGYAGGIMSAAVDGLRVAEAIVSTFAPPG